MAVNLTELGRGVGVHLAAWSFILLCAWVGAEMVTRNDTEEASKRCFKLAESFCLEDSHCAWCSSQLACVQFSLCDGVNRPIRMQSSSPGPNLTLGASNNCDFSAPNAISLWALCNVRVLCLVCLHMGGPGIMRLGHFWGGVAGTVCILAFGLVTRTTWIAAHGFLAAFGVILVVPGIGVTWIAAFVVWQMAEAVLTATHPYRWVPFAVAMAVRMAWLLSGPDWYFGVMLFMLLVSTWETTFPARLTSSLFASFQAERAPSYHSSPVLTR
jgi:hypothetical protein